MRMPSRIAPITAALGTLFSLSCEAIGPITVTRTVTTCTDDDADTGSLRAALESVPSTEDLSVNFSLTCSKISLSSALVNFAHAVTLNGPTDHVLTIDGNRHDRVFIHYGTGAMTVSHLTFARGLYSGNMPGGGGIYAVGDVVLDSATVSESQVYAPATKGGGVFSLGTVTLSHSTISGNVASNTINDVEGVGLGAGIYAKDGFYAYSSTIAANVAGAGGGGVYTLGSGVVVGSTIVNNSAYLGAAILTGSASSSLHISNSTFTGNESVSNPQFANDCSTLTSQLVYLYNATVAKNTCKGVGGTITASKVKIVSSIVAENTNQTGSYDIRAITVVGNNNIVASASSSLPGGTIKTDPMLQSLADNGGPTQTMALAPTSPAINAGDNPLGLTTDQRGAGFLRVSGSAPDIGAFESADEIFSDGFQ